MKTPLPFITENKGLALALHTFGFNLTECRTFYRPESLREKGLRSVQEAVDRGIEGSTKYVFENTPELKKAVAAWKRCSDAKGNVDLPKPEIEDAMAIAFMILKNRVGIYTKWKEKPAMLAVEGEREWTPAEGLPAQFGTEKRSLKIVSANASKATRERVGI